ncbi:MAG TPA: M20 family peptidase [Caulobacteraceae bacterium]|nr:M20 family peptidase [Caulobacteraceae bacterium]
MWKRIGLVVLAAVLVLVAVVAYRTMTFEPPAAVDPAEVELAAAMPFDGALAAQRLGEAIRFQTISNQNPADNQLAEWEKLHAWLQATYPATHGAMRREVIDGHTLFYTWAGSDPSLAPIVLMAHQDVVPVTPGTEGDWKQPPFSGVIADGAVWGRGAIDDKGSLVSIFEAAETLAKAGYKPRRTVLIVSGHNEEANSTGASAAAALMTARGMKAQWVLDEGMAVIEDFPMLNAPVAVVGLGEKGYATLRITARAPGGHSSTPPKETGVEVLAKAVLAITGDPFPMKFEGPAAQMVKSIAPEAGLLVKMAAANEWLFGPLLVSQVSATPAGAAGLHTTIAPTMLKGSPKENVLPQDATAWINYRIAPGQTAEDVMAHARSATRDLDVELAWEGKANNPSPVSSTSSEGWKVIAALASDGGKLPVAPGLVMAGTDSRYMVGAAEDVYRFQPLLASVEELKMIHGTNEHLTLENLERMVVFYQRLIATAAS